MDPLTALGLASSIVQFVDFGCKVVSKSHELYRSAAGASIENIEYESIIHDLTNLNARLTLEPSARSNRDLKSNNQALGDLCSGCNDIAAELLAVLEQAKVQGKHRRWKTLAQVLRSTWSDAKISEISARLDRYRQELNTHILVVLKEQCELASITNDARFDHLDRDKKAIITAILEGHDAFKQDLNNQTRTIQLLQSEEHEKTREVIRTAVGSLGRSKIACDDGVQLSDEEVEDKLLKSLSYSTMQDRLDSVMQAHERTFEWVFDSAVSAMKLKHDFVQWLRDGGGIYWINGKAGSGKSTLFRYLYYHERTASHLRAWSHFAPLNIEGFFFWNSGLEDQRSQSGLLRSLLWQLLSKHRHFLREVFPDEWDERDELRRGSPDYSWTLKHLQQATRRTMNLIAAEEKICLFVDGVDEYEGDYSDVINLLKELSTLANLKLCISSRPLLVFEKAFSSVPNLRLQDLTKQDITRFVRDSLEKNDYMSDLVADHPKAATTLINEIVDKADGVFLWVRLVVKSLLDGLQNGDNMEDLQNRLLEIPASMEALFRHMLNQMSPNYAEQASRIFQIMRARSEIDQELDVLELAFADSNDIQIAISTPLKDITDSVRLSRRNIVTRRLKSRCAGLLEIDSYANVQYIHRTARDFLEGPEIWSQLLGYTSYSKFNAQIWLIASGILLIKTKSTSKPGATVSRWMAHGRQVALGFGKELEKLFDELEKGCGLHMDIFTLAVEEGVCTYVYMKLKYEHTRRKYGPLGRPFLDHTMTLFRFVTYPEVVEVLFQFGADPNETYNGCSIWQKLLHIALERTEYLSRQEMLAMNIIEPLQTFLDYGADPNEPIIAWGEAFPASVVVQKFKAWAEPDGVKPVRKWRDDTREYPKNELFERHKKEAWAIWDPLLLKHGYRRREGAISSGAASRSVALCELPGKIPKAWRTKIILTPPRPRSSLLHLPSWIRLRKNDKN